MKDTSDNLLTDTAHHDKIQLLMRTHVMRENVTRPRGSPISCRGRHLVPPDVGGSPRSYSQARKHHASDAIPNGAIKLAWPYLGEALTALYNLSLNWSVCPDIFKGQAFASSRKR